MFLHNISQYIQSRVEDLHHPNPHHPDPDMVIGAMGEKGRYLPVCLPFYILAHSLNVKFIFGERGKI